MRLQRLAISLAILLLLPLAGAWAQTTTPPPATTPPPEAGSFDKLSPGNQTIAKAIFADQIKPTPPPPTGTGGTGTGTGTTVGGSTTTTGPKPLTLDQIAKLKLDGQGWGVIFRNLKTQGLVTSKNLGQAVSAFHPHHHLNPGPVTSASNRPLDDGGRTRGAAPSNRDDAGDPSKQFGSSGPSSTSGSSNMGGGRMGGGNPGQGGGNAFGRSK